MQPPDVISMIRTPYRDGSPCAVIYKGSASRSSIFFPHRRPQTQHPAPSSPSTPITCSPCSRLSADSHSSFFLLCIRNCCIHVYPRRVQRNPVQPPCIPQSLLVAPHPPASDQSQQCCFTSKHVRQTRERGKGVCVLCLARSRLGFHAKPFRLSCKKPCPRRHKIRRRQLDILREQYVYTPHFSSASSADPVCHLGNTITLRLFPPHDAETGTSLQLLHGPSWTW